MAKKGGVEEEVGMVKENGSTDQNVTNGITVSKNSIRPVASNMGNMDITLT